MPQSLNAKNMRLGIGIADQMITYNAEEESHQREDTLGTQFQNSHSKFLYANLFSATINTVREDTNIQIANQINATIPW